jgi:hypothetical protein
MIECVGDRPSNGMQDAELALLLDLEQLFAEAQPLEDDIG